ncbi:hypothetical protein L6452_42845 [Arctium lappa]|uniref:Uncharacterized protein n=1 Tax=Arctium lappa TaxID=4217 RepID=A0ACB8XKI3_ARCLA|nr:hypothetical protein L6452_42845 [Arctium lappa]
MRALVAEACMATRGHGLRFFKLQLAGTKLADFNSIDEFQMFTGSNPLTNPSVVRGRKPSLKLSSTCSDSFNLLSSSYNFLDQNGNQPSNFSSNQLPIAENYGYSATVSGEIRSSITTTTVVPLEGHGGDLDGAIIKKPQKTKDTVNPTKKKTH